MSKTKEALALIGILKIQHQVDEDGEMVAVSRQALDEAIQKLEALAEQLSENSRPLSDNDIALKDLEIMRLREALNSFDITDSTGLQTLWITTMSAEQVDEAISTPTTYDDLMAWHEAQLLYAKKG